MSRHFGDDRRDSTVLRDEAVHKLYNEITTELGELAREVSRTYIYEKIRARTGLSHRTIAMILNHTPSSIDRCP